jgi:AcrR family transcriptional regulator
MVDPDPDALTVKGRATRDRIITCATELIVAGGVSRLSIESIRKAASVSGSQMTHYFPSRDSLIRAVIAHQTHVLLDLHRQPALRDLDTFEDFDRWAALTMRFGRRKTRTGPVPTYGALICEATGDQAARELLTLGYRQWQELLVAGLQRMKEHGDLVVTADTAQLASVLMSAHQGADAFNVAFRRHGRSARPWSSDSTTYTCSPRTALIELCHRTSGNVDRPGGRSPQPRRASKSVRSGSGFVRR